MLASDRSCHYAHRRVSFLKKTQITDEGIEMKPSEKCKLSCKTGIKKNVIPISVFKRELELCRSLFCENGGKCSWGKCEHCGVIPLLYKLHKGKLLEKSQDIKRVKKKIFKK